MVVVTDEVNANPARGGQHTFRFEAGWIKEELCETIVENAWNLSMNVRGGKVKNAVRGVAADLCDWNCNVLDDLEKRIKKSKRALETC